MSTYIRGSRIRIRIGPQWVGWSEFGFESRMPLCVSVSYLDRDLDQNPRVNRASVKGFWEWITINYPLTLEVNYVPPPL